MNYIVFDLEFNQKHPDNKNLESPDLNFEIIQIGAIKLDNALNTLCTFNELVKPTVFSTIHPYVQKLTNITIDMVTQSNNFKKVFDKFIEFIGSDDYTLIVWGTGDLRELFRNMEFHQIPCSNLQAKYIDIQSYASSYFNYPRGNKIGLKNATNLLTIDIEKDFHNAFNDAYYTAKVFKSLYNKKMKRKSYKIPAKKTHKHANSKLDIEALFNQFEKIYNRNMTNQEKEIIRLAYMMGRTHQFIKDN
ncbi:MAG: exonuclease domain-containing protein [Clostridium sp.]|nr:exonuclease domain-containing protein [Clostridium sp.]